MTDVGLSKYVIKQFTSDSFTVLEESCKFRLTNQLFWIQFFVLGPVYNSKILGFFGAEPFTSQIPFISANQQP